MTRIGPLVGVLLVVGAATAAAQTAPGSQLSRDLALMAGAAAGVVFAVRQLLLFMRDLKGAGRVENGGNGTPKEVIRTEQMVERLTEVFDKFLAELQGITTMQAETLREMQAHAESQRAYQERGSLAIGQIGVMAKTLDEVRKEVVGERRKPKGRAR